MLLLKDILNKNIKKSGLERQLEANQVLHAATQVAQEHLMSVLGHRVKVKGEYFKQGTVYLTVASAVMAQDLRLREQELLRAIHAKLGSDGVKKLRVFVGAVD